MLTGQVLAELTVIQLLLTNHQWQCPLCPEVEAAQHSLWKPSPSQVFALLRPCVGTPPPGSHLPAVWINSISSWKTTFPHPLVYYLMIYNKYIHSGELMYTFHILILFTSLPLPPISSISGSPSIFM